MVRKKAWGKEDVLSILLLPIPPRAVCCFLPPPLPRSNPFPFPPLPLSRPPTSTKKPPRSPGGRGGGKGGGPMGMPQLASFYFNPKLNLFQLQFSPSPVSPDGSTRENFTAVSVAGNKTENPFGVLLPIPSSRPQSPPLR